ncbi:MAG: hypothetical protein SNH28_06205, partial [Rikenellaceae bacterium]
AGNNSSKAVEIKTGSFVDFNVSKEKTKYVLTADVKQSWGKTPKMVVAGYDNTVKKMVDVAVLEMTSDKNYQTVTLKFKSKFTGYHRITFIPNGVMHVDNVKLETK